MTHDSWDPGRNREIKRRMRVMAATLCVKRRVLADHRGWALWEGSRQPRGRVQTLKGREDRAREVDGGREKAMRRKMICGLQWK
jgi:hypothetical protein